MNSSDKELYKQNADRISAIDALDVLAEECGELIQAQSKYKRALGHGIPTNVNLEEARSSLILEIADVMRSCDIVAYKLGISYQDITRTQIAQDEKIAKRFKKEKNHE